MRLFQVKETAICLPTETITHGADVIDVHCPSSHLAGTSPLLHTRPTAVFLISGPDPSRS
jgi:hypothetical protein